VTKHTHCFTRMHMTVRQYGLYSHVRELQRKWGFIYFDGDGIAAGFKDTGRGIIYRECTALLKGGWFETKSAGNRKKDGTHEARKIVALSHKEWVAKYPNKCLQPVSPVILDKGTNQSHLCDSPVSPVKLTSLTRETNQSHPWDKVLVQPRQGSNQASFKAVAVASSGGGVLDESGLGGLRESTDISRSSPSQCTCGSELRQCDKCQKKGLCWDCAKCTCGALYEIREACWGNGNVCKTKHLIEQGGILGEI
jgi:hypothetical protein